MENRYGIPVIISDVLDPNTGDFDGMEIKIDYTLGAEVALFVLIHLFGHTVQWNTSEEFRVLGQDTNLRKTEEEIARIEVYEREATQYSLQLMHDCGVTDLDQWATDWWRADFGWLCHLYRTGEKKPFRDFFRKDSGPVLPPKAIPAFEPRKWTSRWSF